MNDEDLTNLAELTEEHLSSLWATGIKAESNGWDSDGYIVGVQADVLLYLIGMARKLVRERKRRTEEDEDRGLDAKFDDR